MPPRPFPGLRLPLGGVCAVLVGLFYVATIRGGQDWPDDFSQYIHHAVNIADGTPYAATGYIYNPHNPGIGPRTYPPGFPLLLVPGIKVFGLDFRPMKVLVIGFFVGALLVIVALFGGDLPPPHLAALVLVIGLNPFFWEFKDQVLSDIPFLFFVLLSLYLFKRARAADGSERRVAMLAVLAGAAAYASYATRVLGIVLVPCFIAHDLMRTRRIGRETLLAGGTFVALAGAQYLFWIRDSSYLDPFTGGVAGVGQSTVAYLRSLSTLWENGYSDAVRKGAFVAASVLAAVGYARSLRRDVAVIQLFPWLYVAPVIAWPSFQGIRFLIPLIPFYFYYGLLGIQEMDAAVERRWGRKHLVLATLLAGVGVSYAGRYSTLSFGPLAEGISKPESVQLFEFVRDSTAPTDVLVFSRPRALALFTGRRVSGGYRPGDPCELWRYLREIGASYLVTGPEPEVWNTDAVYLRQFVSRFGRNFRPVMTNRDFGVYRIQGDACAPS